MRRSLVSVSDFELTYAFAICPGGGLQSASVHTEHMLKCHPRLQPAQKQPCWASVESRRNWKEKVEVWRLARKNLPRLIQFRFQMKKNKTTVPLMV